MRRARSCYDHIAGRLGVAIAERLIDSDAIVFDGEVGRVSPGAKAALAPLGIDPDARLANAARQRAALPVGPASTGASAAFTSPARWPR